MQDGRVAAWGQNDDGQLEDGTTADRGAPVLVKGLTCKVKSIVAGDMCIDIRIAYAHTYINIYIYRYVFIYVGNIYIYIHVCTRKYMHVCIYR